jgi:glutaredoxin 3
MAATSAAAFVRAEIARAPVVVFSKTYCPYCTKAKSALASVGLSPSPSKYIIHEIDGRPDESDIQDALATITGGRTVPRVFIDGKCIGGGDDTARLAASGKLAEMLKPLL